MKKILNIIVVDDDSEIRALVAQFLEPYGFKVCGAGGGEEMRRLLAKGDTDLVILDLMLPGEDGLTLCREIRARSAVPVIFLTAAGSEADRVVGLEMGADDYLAKPFSTRELLARIRAVLRRSGAAPGPEDLSQPIAPPAGPEILTFAGWALDTGRRQLRSPSGVLVELTGGEYQLLLVLLKSANIVLTRDQLLDATRGRMAAPFDRSIDVGIGRLRRKIELDPKAPSIIKTVRGGGYVLSVPVRST